MINFFFSIFFFIFILILFVIQSSNLNFFSNQNQVKPNLLYIVLCQGFIWFNRNKMIFFILFVVVLLEINSLSPWGFYSISLGFSFIFFYFFLHNFILKFYIFFLFTLISNFLKAILELNLLFFLFPEENIALYVSNIILPELGLNLIITSLWYFPFMFIKIFFNFRQQFL